MYNIFLKIVSIIQVTKINCITLLWISRSMHEQLEILLRHYYDTENYSKAIIEILSQL